MRQVPRDASARLDRPGRGGAGFAAPLAEIRRTLALAAHAGRPSPRLRPLLLVGPPGVGKTWFARRLAQALDLPFASLNLGGATDNRCLQGTARGWSATTPAWPIAEMARLSAPNPVFFLDEIEKAGGQRDTNGRVHDTLLAMIEPESAATWFDECLRTAADLRNAVWIMAANETRGIPAPLLSRLVGPPYRAAAGLTAFDGTFAGLLAGIAGGYRLRPGELPVLESETRQALKRQLRRPPQPAPAAGADGGMPRHRRRSGLGGAALLTAWLPRGLTATAARNRSMAPAFDYMPAARHGPPPDKPRR